MRFGSARVSTRDQNPDSQHDTLAAAGCERVVIDRAASELAHRPKWDRLDEQLRAGDELVITRLSRLVHSIHLAALAGDPGVAKSIWRTAPGHRTTTSAGRFQFHVLAAQDEMLADPISKGTLEGPTATRARDRRGRPTVMTSVKLAAVRRMFDAGAHTIIEVAATIGVGRGTFYRHRTPPVASVVRP